ncbi:MAG: rhodanese-like domain-containing protein [Candidatus Nanopelagicales bacterium]
MKEISVQEALELLTTGKAQALDVRELDEYSAGHIEDVTFNPLSEFDVAKVQSDSPVIVICRSGNRSGRVCEALAESHPNLLNLQGGMKAWAEAGFKMVSDSGNPQVI